MLSDVCLILEGTYPYVAGGVSTWVAQLLEHMPQLRFSLVYIGPRRDQPRVAKYAIPRHVVEIREVFVHDYPRATCAAPARSRFSPAEWDLFAAFQRALADGRPVEVAAVARCLGKLEGLRETMEELAFSREAWERLRRQYETQAPEGVSFLDYFWTHRFINLPALNLLRAALPRARVYHTACTGYAGLLGAKAHSLTGAPLLLTEHGLYTRERRIEIFNARWIQETEAEGFLDLRRMQSYFKVWWTQFFLALSRTAYQSAEHIFTLFEGNREAQHRDGAPTARTAVIPNGLDPAAYLELAPPPRQPPQPLRIGFVGRVTAVKDVKTFLRALSILAARRTPFRGLILGPLDEEEDYARECRQLAQGLGLGETVEFLGRVDVREYLPRLHVVVLTSLSEGMPFVILEANAAGLPVVATQVGACADMLLGRTPADRALGASGLLTPVASPAATAAALERLERTPELAARLGETGRQRVRRFYNLHDVMNRYLQIYEDHLYAGMRRQESKT